MIVRTAMMSRNAHENTCCKLLHESLKLIPMEIKECKLSENAHKNSYCDLEENNDEDIISESCAYIAKSSFTQLPPVL